MNLLLLFIFIFRYYYALGLIERVEFSYPIIMI
jgi:hypothetical protein